MLFSFDLKSSANVRKYQKIFGSDVRWVSYFVRVAKLRFCQFNLFHQVMNLSWLLLRSQDVNSDTFTKYVNFSWDRYQFTWKRLVSAIERFSFITWSFLEGFTKLLKNKVKKCKLILHSIFLIPRLDIQSLQNHCQVFTPRNLTPSTRINFDAICNDASPNVFLILEQPQT